VAVIVVKAEPGRDFYVGWSTEYEAPIWWGSRADVLKILAGRVGDDPPEVRVARADAHGTSAIGGFSFFGRWDDERFMYEQRGCLPRSRLIAACVALDRDDDEAVWDLLEPIEEGMTVRRG
jgi:hypothetical protein